MPKAHEIPDLLYNDEPEFAYTVDPNGTPDPNNYHLSYDSFCMDRGNPFHDSNDVGFFDMDTESRIYGSYVDIGADEVYSCYEPLTEDDISHSLDWSHDGIVNYAEFNVFSRAWLSRDPNDPSIITDPNFIGDPDYADPDTLAQWGRTWNWRCNLDDSDLKINLTDLNLFLDNWLWIACWKAEQITEMMASGGGESMMMSAPMMMETTASTEVVEPDSKTLEQNILIILAEIEDAIKAGHPNTKALYEMKAFLEETLSDLKSTK